MISKELLSKVLGKEIQKFAGDGWFAEAELTYWREYRVHRLNLDTLTRLCKEWLLRSDIDSIDVYMYKDYTDLEISGMCSNGERGCSLFNTKAKTELEVVIKACEWLEKEIKIL